MKTKGLFMTLMAVVAATLLAACTPTPITPSNAYFSVGETVGHATKQQFLSITSEYAWTISIDYIAPEGESGWCTLSKTSGEGNANILMNFGANPLSEERMLSLTITLPSEQLVLNFTQRSQFTQTSPADLSGWLELPTFEADGNRYYFSKHMLPSTSNRERSFSIFYDSENYLPLWVAYPLCRGNMYGGGHRVNDWGIMDPNIPTEKQLRMSSSYQGSYDRGHMLPSASRLGSDNDNRQTFYPTNMTPQIAGLNQQKWAVIEGYVRDWAEGCDTLYVVTGAVMQTVGGGEQVNYTYCKSDSSKDVAIPNYYYKALLQYRNVGGSKSYQALALWLPHKPASGAPKKSDVLTIDQLEELTGYDFFHNLDESIQNSVESSIDYLYWGGIE
jgi:endonuclease G